MASEYSYCHYAGNFKAAYLPIIFRRYVAERSEFRPLELLSLASICRTATWLSSFSFQLSHKSWDDHPHSPVTEPSGGSLGTNGRGTERMMTLTYTYMRNTFKLVSRERSQKWRSQIIVVQIVKAADSSIAVESSPR